MNINSLNNLTPVTTHEEAVARGRVGGSKPKTKWSWRKYCSSNCKFYDRCPLVTISKSKKKSPCMVKALDHDGQNTFLNIFERGEEGLIVEALKLYKRLIEKLGKDVKSKELMSAIETSMLLKKGIYGDKDSKDQTIINVIVSNQVDV